MSNVSEKVNEQIESSDQSRLNNVIALIVAISASLMTIYNIKDNNIVQTMSQTQAHVIDSWSYFQAKSIKQSLVENHVIGLELQLTMNQNLKPEALQAIETKIQEGKNRITRYEVEKGEIASQAEAYQKEYDRLNIHDDQFDFAEALISLGLSLFGITILTKKKSLFYFATALSGCGVFFGLAGFLGWSIHPEWLAKILG